MKKSISHIFRCLTRIEMLLFWYLILTSVTKVFAEDQLPNSDQLCRLIEAKIPSLPAETSQFDWPEHLSTKELQNPKWENRDINRYISELKANFIAQWENMSTVTRISPLNAWIEYQPKLNKDIQSGTLTVQETKIKTYDYGQVSILRFRQRMPNTLAIDKKRYKKVSYSSSFFIEIAKEMDGSPGYSVDYGGNYSILIYKNWPFFVSDDLFSFVGRLRIRGPNISRGQIPKNQTPAIFVSNDCPINLPKLYHKMDIDNGSR